MTKQEIIDKINKLENGIKSKATPSNLITPLKAQKRKFEELLKEREEAEKKAVKTKKVSKVAEKIKAAKTSVAKKTPAKAPAKEERKKDNIARDGDRKSLPSGKRISKTGKVYYETRANRSDKQTSKKPYLADGGETDGWKKSRTRKLKTREEAEKAIVKFSELMGRAGRNYKVEKMDDGYVISYESNYEPKMDDGGKLPNGKYKYVKGDEGMFQGDEVRVVKYHNGDRTYEYNIIEEDGKVKTHGVAKAERFENQFRYFPKMAYGGETEEGVDLFEDYENIPTEVQKILDKHSDAFEDGDYRKLEKANNELKKIGYTFEYGLDGEAYDLRKIGQKGKMDEDEYAKGGELKKAQLLIIDPSNPLSTQLKKLTGDFLNSADFKDIGSGNFNILTHKHSNKVFIVYPKRIYDSLPEQEKQDDINYLKNVEKIKLDTRSMADGGEIDETKEWKKQMIKNNKETIEYLKNKLERAQKIGQSENDIKTIKRNIDFHTQIVGEYEKELASMAHGGYVIFEGHDHYNDKPLYKVISKDEDNDYEGEFHDNREDAEKELNELKKENMNYSKGGNTDKLYTKLVEEHSKGGYERMGVGFDRFLKMKMESASAKGNMDMYYKLMDVEQMYENDFYAKGGYMADGGEVNKFTYMMLGRLKSDNDYYLGHGNRYEKALWAGNVDDQISEMKKLWNELPEDKKPEWLSMEDILEYERKMKSDKMADGGEVEKYVVEKDKDGSYKILNTEKGMYVDQTFETKSSAESWKKEKDLQRERFGYESYFADGGQVPAHFGSGKNIEVFGYETKNFDICGTAVKEFEAAVDIMKDSKELEKESLAYCAKYVDNLFGIEKVVVEGGIGGELNFSHAVSDIMSASTYNFRAGMAINLYSFVPQHLMEIALRLAKAEKGGFYALGGMTAGRWYKDKSGEEFKFIGKVDSGANKGRFLFSDGQKSVYKDLEEFEGGKPKETKLFGFFADGGSVAEGNYEMLMSNIKAIKHHAEELADAVKPDTEIEAWVLSKSERAETDLSDITHYLDGLKMEKGGYMADGGKIKDQYQGKSPEYLWNNWTEKQREHFNHDHELVAANDFRLKSSFDELPEFMKKAISEHYKMGQYAYGGYMADGGKVGKMYFKKGDIVYVFQSASDKNGKLRKGIDAKYVVGSEKDKNLQKWAKVEVSEVISDELGWERYRAKKIEGDYDLYDKKAKNGEMIAFMQSNSSKYNTKPISMGYTEEERYMAKGGDLNSIKEEYLKNEDENAHSENVVLLAKHFGTKEDLAKAKEILALHEKEGSLSSENGKKRQELHLKLIGKARAEMSKQGIEFEKGGYMAKGGEVRYKLAGNNFGQQIESGKKFAELIKKAHENQTSEHKYPENFIKEIAYTGKIVKNDGTYFLKDYSYKGVLDRFEFLGDKYFLESLKYLNRPTIKNFKFEDGGMMAKGGVTKDSVIRTLTSDKNQYFLEKDNDGYILYISPRGAMNSTFHDKFKVEDLGTDGTRMKYRLSKLEKGGYMAKGGKVKFADKVKSVQESLLKRKKVAPQVQKDYGKTYNKAEAKESAQRIVGSRMAQLKEKMAKKKK